MGFEDYEKAQKSGLKAYKTAVQKGQHPYLPVLDDILKEADIRSDVQLKGVRSIPLDRVVGTKTEGRTHAFANNFMPLLDLKTEFGSKWTSLCDAHKEEGIRDPIKVYEYMNYYYVEEGNKRVSVLKYFDADSISANVIRKVPKLTDDPAVKVYYEYMDFNKITGINLILLTQVGSYKAMLELLGLGTDPETAEPMDEVEGKIFSSTYRLFAKTYKEKGGDKLANLSVGDAFLIFLKLYTYEKAKEMLPQEIKESITKIWGEFQIANNNDVLDLQMTAPDEVEKKTLFGLISNANKGPITAAFIYDRDPETSDWLYAHELGRNYIKDVFSDKLRTLKVIASTETEAISAMEDLIEKEKVGVIFTTTSKYIDASLKIATKYPEVKVLNCSLNTSHKYIRTYYARLFEAKFLSGIIAGALADKNKIGYLADYPIFGNIACINAFAIGAKMVNPRVKVYLEWTTVKKQTTLEDLYKEFYDNEVYYVSDQDMGIPTNGTRKFGLYRLSSDETENIALTVYNWGKVYEKILKIIQGGTWNETGAGDKDKAINYWWGFQSDAIDILCSKKVPEEVKKLTDLMKTLMKKGEFSPFEGVIKDQNGNIRNEDGEKMKPEEIMTMDWLCDNVVGMIPVRNELEEKAKDIVELKGVLKEDEDTGNS